MEDRPGKRVERVAVRVFQSGAPVVVNGVPGFGVKATGIGRYVDPTTSAATEVEVGEHFTHFVKGCHPIALAGGIAAAVVGSKLWIDPDDDTVRLHADRTAGDLPLGVVDEIDAARTPDVAYVNMEELHAFLPYIAGPPEYPPD